MSVRNLLLSACFGAAVAVASEFTVPVRTDIAADITRAAELERNGYVREAERVMLGVIRRAEAAGSKLELAIALNNLAVLYLGTDRYTDAERQFTRSIRILKALEGDTAAQALAKTRLHLAAMYLESGRSAEAEKLDLPKLIETLRSVEDKARAKGAMAGVKASRKDLDGAEQTYLELLSFWTEPSRAAENQTEIATIRNNLGVIALWQGRPEVARERLEQSFADWQRIGGPANPNVVKAMANVATVFVQLKQYDEAEMWLARSAALGRTTFGEFHPFVVGIQIAQTEALKKAGRKAEARELARTVSEARKMVRRPSTADYTVDYRDLQTLRARSPRP